MSSEKPTVSKFVMSLIFLIGLQLISTYITTVSIAGQWIHFFGLKNYNLMNFLASVPNLLIAPFIPFIVGKYNLHTIFFVNISVQLVASILLISAPFMSGQVFPFISSNSAYIIGFAVAISSLLISSAFFAIAQTAIFVFAAQFSEKGVHIFITGFASANLILSVHFVVLNVAATNMFNQHIYSYLPAILLQFVGVFAFLKAKALSPVKTKAIDENGKSIPAESNFQLFKKVVGQKWLFLVLNFFLFYETFIIYPTMMFNMTPATPSLATNWGNILMFIFGVSEVSARTLNMFDLAFLRKAITEQTLLILCLVRYAVCIVPLFVFISVRGYYPMNAVVADIVNVVFYASLAFSLGLLGNNIAIFMYSQMKDEEDIRVAGTLFNFSIVFGILCGSLTSYLIVQYI